MSPQAQDRMLDFREQARDNRSRGDALQAYALRASGGALSSMLSASDSSPLFLDWKITWTSHLALAASVPGEIGQVSVCIESASSSPMIEIQLIAASAGSMPEITTSLDALVVPAT